MIYIFDIEVMSISAFFIISASFIASRNASFLFMMIVLLSSYSNSIIAHATSEGSKARDFG
jgi:hypothetical protein